LLQELNSARLYFNIKFANEDKLMAKLFLTVLLIANMNLALEKSAPTGREKAIAKLLAALPAILQRADLGRIKIEPSEDGNSFTSTIYYKSLPQDSAKSLNQQPETKKTPAAGTAVENPDAAKSARVNHEAALCQCSRCEYIRKSHK
jgi:hypothetical protein